MRAEVIGGWVVLAAVVIAFARFASAPDRSDPQTRVTEAAEKKGKFDAQLAKEKAALDAPFIAEAISKLELLKTQQLWTGLLEGNAKVKARIPLPIFSSDGATELRPLSAGDDALLQVAQGTEFKVVSWSEVGKYPHWLLIKLADGRDGFLESGYKNGLQNGTPLPLDPYDHGRGVDTNYWQQIYTQPMIEAKRLQAIAQTKLDAEQARIESANAAARAAAERDRKFVAAQEAREAQVAAREAKKQGVRIGMSKAQVIGSMWGKPRKVNRTTTAYSESEQWVYDGGYLYFTDGVLTAIQN